MNTPCDKNDLEDRIIRVARSLFIERGFAETSMSDIAATVGINRPVLHYYFRTKSRMFQAVFGDIVQSIVPTVFTILAQKDKPLDDRIGEIVDAYYALFLAHPRLPMFIVREMNRDADLLIRTAMHLQLPEQLHDTFISLREEMDSGKVKRIPIRFLFYNFYGMLSIPFLTQDFTHTIFLEKDENMGEMLKKWKVYIIAQMHHLLLPD